jgi:hypothetical protein
MHVFVMVSCGDGASLFLCFLACICDVVHRLCAENFCACKGIGGTDLAASRGEAKIKRQGIASST